MFRVVTAVTTAVILFTSGQLMAMSNGQQSGYVMPASYQPPRQLPPPPRFQPYYPQYQPLPKPQLRQPLQQPYPYRPMVMVPAPKYQPAGLNQPRNHVFNRDKQSQNHAAEEKVAVISPEPHGKRKSETAAKISEENQPQKIKSLSENKQAFLSKIAPMVHNVNQRVLEERDEVQTILRQLDAGTELSQDASKRLSSLKRKYRVKGETSSQLLTDELLPKIDIIPVELALAQAANESAWGKSRFAREAQNLFGVWTYDESKGIVPKKRAKGAKHLVRKYESLEESISHYITLLNSHPAYKELRDIRLTLRESGQELDGHAMAAGLLKYSAKGEKYVAIIRSMINSNNLTDFRQV